MMKMLLALPCNEEAGNDREVSLAFAFSAWMGLVGAVLKAPSSAHVQLLERMPQGALA